MHIIRGKELVLISAAEFEALRSGYKELWIDLGTGDGRFAYREALANPQVLMIGIEPAFENLLDIARKASKKPEKGGAKNLLFVRASAEDLPQELEALCAHLSINYPWGSLLKGVALGEPLILSGLSKLLAKAGVLEIRLNYFVFENEADRVSLGLPLFDEDYLNTSLNLNYSQFGLRLEGMKLGHQSDGSGTSWGKHLSLGSDRKTLNLRFIKER